MTTTEAIEAVIDWVLENPQEFINPPATLDTLRIIEGRIVAEAEYLASVAD